MQQKPKRYNLFLLFVQNRSSSKFFNSRNENPKHKKSTYVTEKPLKDTILFVRKTYLRVLCRSNSKVPRQGLRKAKRI